MQEELQCRFCEQWFSPEQIRQGVPMPTMRNQHYRLIEMDGAIHTFIPVGRKKNQRRIKNELSR